MVNRICSQLLNSLLPRYCALCGLPSHRDLALCAGCEQDLPPNPHACYRCAIPLTNQLHTGSAWRDSVNEILCGACVANPPAFDRVIAPWLYGECMAHLIQRWKFQKERALTPLLFYLMQHRLREPYNVDLIVPVPLHWSRHWQRGFNQAQLLSSSIYTDIAAQRNGRKVEHCQHLVRRTRATTAQSGINATARRNNLTDAFTVRKRCDNLRIALIDDVVTTGATVAAIAHALKRAGAVEVQVHCLARTPSPGG